MTRVNVRRIASVEVFDQTWANCTDYRAGSDLNRNMTALNYFWRWERGALPNINGNRRMSRFETLCQAANLHQGSELRDDFTISMSCANPKVGEPLDASSITYSDTTSVFSIVMIVEVHGLAHYRGS